MMLKGIRHFFGIYTKEEREKQKAINDRIEKEYKMVKEFAEKQSTKDYREQRRRQTEIDSKCSKCGGTNIVDKISRLQGEGSIRGSFFLGTGSISGHSEMDTNEVNNCNDCGHQWKKTELCYKDAEHIIYQMVSRLKRISKGEWGHDEDTRFLKQNDISRNTICKLNKEYNWGRYIGDPKILGFEQL